MSDRMQTTGNSNRVQLIQQDMDRVRRQAEHMRNQAIGQAMRDIRTSAVELMGNLRLPYRHSGRAERKR
ncbi:MAG: hypothetical protein R6V11_08685 [Ectothiorhodospiraceae bacterium]